MKTNPEPQSVCLPESEGDPITRAFIGHAMKVHSLVGPGLDEEIYQQELAAALTVAGIAHLSKPRRDLVCRGIVADTFEPDFVIENHFIPELKCLLGSFAGEHMVQAFFLQQIAPSFKPISAGSTLIGASSSISAKPPLTSPSCNILKRNHDEWNFPQIQGGQQINFSE